MLVRDLRQPDVSRLILVLLALYKRWISPLLGPRCRFHPSCSEYARVSVARFGAMRGCWLAASRLARCHPLCDGGIDPVPMAFSWRARRAQPPSNGTHHD